MDKRSLTSTNELIDVRRKCQPSGARRTKRTIGPSSNFTERLLCARFPDDSQPGPRGRPSQPWEMNSDLSAPVEVMSRSILLMSASNTALSISMYIVLMRNVSALSTVVLSQLMSPKPGSHAGKIGEAQGGLTRHDYVQPPKADPASVPMPTSLFTQQAPPERCPLGKDPP
ncbi:Coagulation factor VII [Manis javanica]|nr:Coagulation factor VII [Manis javanica]